MTVLGLLVLILAACDLTGESNGARDIDLVVAVGDTLRDVRLHIPATVSAGDAVSLLVALHGSSDNGRNFQRGAKLDDKTWDDMVVAYPTAAKGNWAEGCNCNISDRLHIDDIGFMEALIDSVGARFSISRDRTFAMGYSQGGLFAYRLACDLGDRFASIVAVSAPMSKPLSISCLADRPVSVLTFHGKRDAVFPWDGTNNGPLSLLSAPETVEFWSSKYSCGRATASTVRSGDASVVQQKYETCDESAQVHLYELPDGKHTWYTRSPDVRDFILDFFEL